MSLSTPRVLCVVPARGGSQRLPGKNLASVRGLSMVGGAVREARAFLRRAGLLNGSVVVDTDDATIAAEGIRWGAAVPVLREAQFATSDATSAQAILRLLERLDAMDQRFEAVVLVQPTSPLRTSDDLLDCWSAFDLRTAPSVTSVTKARYPSESMLSRTASGQLDWVDGKGVLRAGEALEQWQLTGAVYIVGTDWLRTSRIFVKAGETIGVETPFSRSIDVDESEDLLVARAIAGEKVRAVVRIGERAIGGGAPCYIIAEAGVNHNGDLAMAHRLIDVAADAGADAVKFQTFDPDLVAGPDAPKAEYQAVLTDAGESQRDMLRRLALGPDAFRSLAEHAEARGIEFLSTAFDAPSLAVLDDIGVPAFKVPSGEITNTPFLRELSRRGLPLLVSTGMCDISEVAAAMDTIADAGNPPVILLHCVSAYPALPEDCNLLAMATLESVFRVPTGWSDHTVGIEISLAAVSMGACLIEKHFTLDRRLPGPDHAASLEPKELAALVRGIRLTEAARGTGEKVPTESERDTANVARRSVHFARPLAAGAVVGADDLTLLRPGTGVAPIHMGSFVGRRLVRPATAGEQLAHDHFNAQ